MGGVQRRKSRRKTTIKITKNARKKKKQINPAINDSVLKKHWDSSKTLQQNMKDLGLAYNSNDVIKIPKRKKITRKDILKEDAYGSQQMDVETETVSLVQNTAVIEEFEKQAANGVKIERHISPGEAKFLMELMKSYGRNYKKMSKDKRNFYQHTPKKLQRKCEGLLKSPLLPKYKEMYPELSTGESMDI